MRGATDDHEAYTIITQEGYDQFPSGLPQDQFPAFEGYAQYNQQPVFPGPPTPPNQHGRLHNQPQPAQGMNGAAGKPHAAVDGLAISKAEPSEDLAQSRRQGSHSDDDDLTPAQSRRKAQNRAAYVHESHKSTPLFAPLG